MKPIVQIESDFVPRFGCVTPQIIKHGDGVVFCPVSGPGKQTH